MKRRHFLAAGVSAAAAVGYFGPDRVIELASDTLRTVTNDSLPDPVEGSWVEHYRDPQNTRVGNGETTLTEGVQNYWERAPDDSGGGFRSRTARVRDGTLYVASEDKTYAFDARSGETQWTADLPADDIIPGSEEVYLSTSVRVNDGDELVEITRYDAGSGERLGVLYEQPLDTPLFDYTLTEEAFVAGQSEDETVRVLSRADGEERWRTFARNGYAVASGYVFASDGNLTAYDLASGNEQWERTGEGLAGPSSDFGRPIVQDGLVFVRDKNRNEVAAFDGSGALVGRYSPPNGIADTPIVTEESLIVPHAAPDSETDQVTLLSKYQRQSGGELRQEWTAEEFIQPMYCAFDNGVVGSEVGYTDTEGQISLAVDVPAFYDGSEWTRYVQSAENDFGAVGPVLSNALFTFGDSVKAYAP